MAPRLCTRRKLASSCRKLGCHGRRAGFTLIELMVVIAIIVLAAGLMTPTITDFFKNRQLERVRGEFGAAFNSARLKAVTEGVPTSLVFFREGVAIYDERKKRVFEDLSKPESALLSSGQLWYVLGFQGNRTSLQLKSYSRWKEQQAEASAAAPRKAAGTTPADPTQSVTGLPKITFNRDGSLSFATGADVSSSFFKEAVPSSCDIIIYQANNTTACFMDLRGPGQLRFKFVPLADIPQKPAEGEDAAGDAT